MKEHGYWRTVAILLYCVGLFGLAVGNLDSQIPASAVADDGSGGERDPDCTSCVKSDRGKDYHRFVHIKKRVSDNHIVWRDPNNVVRGAVGACNNGGEMAGGCRKTDFGVRSGILYMCVAENKNCEWHNQASTSGSSGSGGWSVASASGVFGSGGFRTSEPKMLAGLFSSGDRMERFLR